MRLVVATGCDARMFWQTLILLESAGAELPVMVCDYGLAPDQAEHLRRRGRLLEPIQDGWSPERRHVFYYKTALGQFLRGIPDADMVAWLDADTVLSPGAATALSALAADLAAQGASVAACPDGIGRFAEFADVISPRHAAQDLFRPSFRAYGLDDARIYLNVGVFLCRPAFLADWDAVALAIPPQICLDQSAFNIAAHRGGGLHVLPAETWNCHSTLLDSVALVDGTPMAGAARVQVLHATSTLGQVVNRRITLRHGAGETVAELKLFADPALQARQLELFRAAAAAALG